MSFINLTREEKSSLLDIAMQSIRYGLQHNAPLPVEVSDYSPQLQANAASFVTLNLHKQLRGCIGTLEAHQALVRDVAEHAYAAAFSDPRFSAVTAAEVEQLDIHISILTPGEAIDYSDEADLLRQLEPGTDGLILQDEFHRATFLPSVWEQLKEPEEFLGHLKRKAGWPADYWSDDIRAFRYRAISIE